MGDALQTQAVENQMEFRLISPTEKGFLKHIEWNREELEAAIRAKVAEYSGVAYTEETMKAAKSDRAELNKLLKAIEERRKKVKEIINKPYADFEKELKEVTALIANQVSEIDRQVKEFEAREKEEKEKAIRAAYDEAIGELAEDLPFEKVFNQRYLNKTFKLSAAENDVRNKIETVRMNLETIDSVCGKFKLNAKDVYLRTMDLSKAMAEEKRLKELEEKMEADRIRKEKEAEERRKAEEERKRQEEERRRKEAEEQKASPEPQALAEPQTPGAEQIEYARNTDIEGVRKYAEMISAGPEYSTPAQPTQEAEVVDPFAQKPAEEKKKKLSRVRFYAIGTMEELKGLVQYMKENGIKYGKVE